MANSCLFVISLILAMMFNVSFSGPTRDSEPIWEKVDHIIKVRYREPIWENFDPIQVRDREPIWENFGPILTEPTSNYDLDEMDFAAETHTTELSIATESATTTESATATEFATAKESTSDYDSNEKDSVTETHSTESSTTTESAYDGHPYWESIDPWISELPSDAIVGGYENETLYIIRSRYKGCLAPGKFIPSQHKGFIPWGYKSHEGDELEILRGNHYKWVQSTRNIPKGAVVGGISERNHDLLYVCRGTHLGFTIPGKIDPHFKSCYIPYDDLEIEKGMGNYEVLVIPEEISPPVIISKPSEVFKGVEGKDSLTIPCETTGNPEPIITWKLKNTTISNDSKYSIEDGNLIINEPTASDSQSYTCEASNDLGSVSATFQAEILQEPQILGGRYQAALIGKPTEIECLTKGVPKPELTWEFMPKTGFEYILLQNSENVLKITEVNPKHAGVYRCTARNSVGETVHLTSLLVQRVILTESPAVYKAVEGKDELLRVPCAATGRPDAIITWILNGVAIVEGSKFSIEYGDLVIKNPMVSDSQMYTCAANSDEGSSYAIARVEILKAPQILGERFEVVVVENAAEIKCMAEGVPTPEITWAFMPKDGFEYVMLQNSENVLKIPEVKPKDAGVYRCTARNSVGEKQHYTKLIVQRSLPNIITDSTVIYKGIEGKDELLRIPCVAIGIPEPTVTWDLNGVTIVQDSKFSIENGALVIKNPTVSDSQIYTCTAYNDVGTAHALFRVEIVPENIDDPTPLSRQILRSFISRWFQWTSETSSDEPTTHDVISGH